MLPRWRFFFFGIGLTGEESSTSLLVILWGRTFYIFTGDCLNMFRSIREESSTSFMGMMLDILELFKKDSSASFIGMMVDRFDPFEEESSASLLRIVFFRCLKY